MDALRRLAPVARTIPWPALAAGTLACIAVKAAVHTVDASALDRWSGVGALAICTGAAFLLDDAAHATTNATPIALARRRALTLAASAVALRTMPQERGDWTGVIALFALLGFAYVPPHRWTLLTAPGDDASSRDPARPTRHSP